MCPIDYLSLYGKYFDDRRGAPKFVRLEKRRVRLMFMSDVYLKKRGSGHFSTEQWRGVHGGVACHGRHVHSII